MLENFERGVFMNFLSIAVNCSERKGLNMKRLLFSSKNIELFCDRKLFLIFIGINISTRIFSELQSATMTITDN